VPKYHTVSLGNRGTHLLRRASLPSLQGNSPGFEKSSCIGVSGELSSDGNCFGSK
jgi:hypothetical protein